MKVEIQVPAMGESITEATVGEIIKPSGTVVSVDDEILELETDKVNQVLYAPEAGMVTLTVKPEETVTIGQTIGYIDSEAAPAPAPEKKEKPPEPEPIVEGGARQPREAYVKEIQPKPTPPPTPTKVVRRDGETRTPMTRIRKVIAKRLVEAQQSTAMLTTFNEVDMSTIMALRTKYKEAFQEKHGVKLGFMSFFVKAAVSALKEIPDINSYIDGEDVVHREYFNIGIAVGTERGLVVPVVRNCDQLTFAEIEAAIVEYATKARKGRLSVDDLQGGGFTITNGGVYGSLLSTPILNSPQSGILGMHKIEKRPIALNDEVVIRPMMYVALSYDHRIIDGKEAVTFLVHMKECLEDPVRMLLFKVT